MPYPDHFSSTAYANAWEGRPMTRAASNSYRQQVASEQAMHAALTQCAATIQALEFPLGEPVVGYDIKGIVEALHEFRPEAS